MQKHLFSIAVRHILGAWLAVHIAPNLACCQRPLGGQGSSTLSKSHHCSSLICEQVAPPGKSRDAASTAGKALPMAAWQVCYMQPHCQSYCITTYLYPAWPTMHADSAQARNPMLPCPIHCMHCAQRDITLHSTLPPRPPSPIAFMARTIPSAAPARPWSCAGTLPTAPASLPP